MKPDKRTPGTMDLFSEPGSENQEQETASRRKPTPTPSSPPRKPKGKSSGQGFLPGLSRRGRPRLDNPVPPAVRAAASRKNRMDGGAKRIELMLDGEVATQLDSLSKHFKETRVELLSRLITKAAKKLAK